MVNQALSQKWKDWFKEHSSRFLLYARQQAANSFDAEDILQDAIFQLIKSAKFNEIPEEPYIYKSIKNKAVDYARSNVRRLRREELVHQDSEPKSYWFSHDLENKERHELIETKLKNLPKEQQEILVLKIWGEQTFQQIATTLNISQNTAASRYRYALKSLQKSLRGENGLEIGAKR